MLPNTAHLIERFHGLYVLVVGDAMLDRYIEGRTERICREAPVPIVAVERRVDVPGGAGNAAANIAALGARCSLLSVAGDDVDGLVLRRVLCDLGVGTTGVVNAQGRRSLVKHRVAANGQMLVRYDEGTTAPADPPSEDALLRHLHAAYHAADAVLVSDYGYGTLTDAVVDLLQALQAASPKLLVVDAKDPRRYKSLGPTAVKPNYAETLRLLRLPEFGDLDMRAEVLAAHAGEVLQATGAYIAAVTLDADGALILERGAPPYRTYAKQTTETRAIGAGDTFSAAMALALAAGATAPEAAEIASAAAAIVVSRPGTTCCPAEELTQYLSAKEKRIPDARLLGDLAASWRRQGRCIVFTNGCFDIIHRGHVTYLNRAKLLGDVLVVGLNSDASVRRLKGEGRPINGLEDRLQVLAAMSCVDYVVPFEEETPAGLIEALRPDVFAKGGDYAGKELPEASSVLAYGGRVAILDFVEDRSTTRIIDRIRQTSGAA